MPYLKVDKKLEKLTKKEAQKIVKFATDMINHVGIQSVRDIEITQTIDFLITNNIDLESKFYSLCNRLESLYEEDQNPSFKLVSHFKYKSKKKVEKPEIKKIEIIFNKFLEKKFPKKKSRHINEYDWVRF